MTSERWQRVKNVFHSAVEREPGERAAFLDYECAGDLRMREEVESLLGYDTSDRGFMEPAVHAAGELLAEEWATVVREALSGR